VPVTDSIKKTADGFLVDTVAREGLYAMQTPQVFDAALLKAAYQKAAKDGVNATDDCQLVERLGVKIPIVPGSGQNMKITTRDDIPAAEAVLRGREDVSD